MIAALRRLWALFTDMTLPAQVPSLVIPGFYADDPEADGRAFAWVKVKDYAGHNPVFPVIVRTSGYAGPKLDFITEPRVLKLEEYGLSVNQLAERYPVPVKEER